ncbi:hypothetical protein B0J15DRAFT_406330, partial [Fusarium solani]
IMILSEFPDQCCNEFPSQKRSKSIKDTMISLDKTFTARNSPLIVVVKHIGHRAVHGKIAATGRLLGRRALSSRISLCEQRTKRRPRKGIEWTEQPQFDLNMKPLQELSEFCTLALSRRGVGSPFPKKTILITPPGTALARQRRRLWPLSLLCTI